MMTVPEFKKLCNRMVDTYGVKSWLMNDQDEAEEYNDYWFCCPNCDEPILYLDWCDAPMLEEGYCPVCEENFYEEEEE